MNDTQKSANKGFTADEKAAMRERARELKSAGRRGKAATVEDFLGCFEICFYGWREGAGHEFFGPSNATDTWPIKKVIGDISAAINSVPR